MTQELLERRSQLASYLSSDPQNSDLLSELSAIDYRLGHFDHAHSNALAALNISPQASAHAVLGLIAMARKQPAQAAEHLGNAVELGDPAPLLRYQLAHALIQTGRYEEAQEHAQVAAQHAQELPLAPALYVRALHYLGKLEEAIAYGNEIAEQPGLANAALLGTLASVYMDEDDLDNAERMANLALAQNPDDTDSKVILGMLALAEADREQALDTFQSLTESHPNSGRAWLGLGLSQLLGNSLEAAAEPLQKAATTMQNHPGTLIALAWTHILNKKPQEAEHALSTALEVDRNFAEVHGSLAVVALMTGNLDGAVQASKRAHGLDPDNFSGNFATSLIQQLSGNREQAKATMDKLLSLSVMPDGEPLHATIARALARGL